MNWKIPVWRFILNILYPTLLKRYPTLFFDGLNSIKDLSKSLD